MLGECTGWDQTDENEYHFYNFIPNSNLDHLKIHLDSIFKSQKKTDISFDWFKGRVKFWKEDGTETLADFDVAFVINSIKVELTTIS